MDGRTTHSRSTIPRKSAQRSLRNLKKERNLKKDGSSAQGLVMGPWMLAPSLAAVPFLLGYLTLADILLELPIANPSRDR